MKRVLTGFSMASAILAFSTALPAAEPSLTPRYLFETSLGNFTVETNAEKAPSTALNFDQYATSGFYEQTIAHRVIPGFLVQMGGYTVDLKPKTDGLGTPIRNEWRNGLTNSKGTIAMARKPGFPDTATSQFFVNLRENKGLTEPHDGAAYAVFGTVVEGLDVVEKFASVPRKKAENLGNFDPASAPVTPIVINKVTAIAPLDREKAQEQVHVLMAEIERQLAEEKAKYEAEGSGPAEFPADVRALIGRKEKELGKTAESSNSGLTWIEMKPPTGTTLPGPTSKISCHYTGLLIDGTQFDSSIPRGEPFEVDMRGGVIQGWLEGLALMKEGEKRFFILPPDIAYGEAGAPPSIPPNAFLTFEIEVLSIK